jgi:hypothetical protein
VVGKSCGNADAKGEEPGQHFQTCGRPDTIETRVAERHCEGKVGNRRNSPSSDSFAQRDIQIIHSSLWHGDFARNRLALNLHIRVAQKPSFKHQTPG